MARLHGGYRGSHFVNVGRVDHHPDGVAGRPQRGKVYDADVVASQLAGDHAEIRRCRHTFAVPTGPGTGYCPGCDRDLREGRRPDTWAIVKGD